MSAELFALVAATLAVAVQVYAAATLLVAGTTKLRAPLAFEAALAAYRVLPDALVAPVARGLPLVEVALGAALLLPPVAAIAAPPAALLLLVFAGAVAVNLLRGRTQLDCGCGTGATIDWSLVAGNAALAASLLATTLVPPGPTALIAGGAALGLGLVLVKRTIAAIVPRTARLA